MSRVFQEEGTESQITGPCAHSASIQLVNRSFTQMFQIPKPRFIALSQVVSRMGYKIIWGLGPSRLEGNSKAAHTTLSKFSRSALYVTDMWPTANRFFHHLKIRINEFMTWKLYFVFHYKGTSLFEMVLKICVVSFLFDKFYTGSVPVGLCCLIRPGRGDSMIQYETRVLRQHGRLSPSGIWLERLTTEPWSVIGLYSLARFTLEFSALVWTCPSASVDLPTWCDKVIQRFSKQS